MASQFLPLWQRDTSLEEFNEEVGGWLPILPEVALLRMIGQMLANVVQREELLQAVCMDGFGGS